MLKCKEVKKVWRELNLETVRCTLSDAQTAREMVEAVLKLKSNKQATVIMLLYLWWGERNRWREEGRRRTIAELAYIAAFQADAALKPKSAPLSDSRQKSRWETGRR